MEYIFMATEISTILGHLYEDPTFINTASGGFFSMTFYKNIDNMADDKRIKMQVQVSSRAEHIKAMKKGDAVACLHCKERKREYSPDGKVSYQTYNCPYVRGMEKLKIDPALETYKDALPDSVIA